jgi:hypothetical protein
VTLRLYELDRIDLLTRPVALLLALLVSATLAASLLKRTTLPREAAS